MTDPRAAIVIALACAACGGDDGGSTADAEIDAPPGIPDAEDGDAPPPTDCSGDGDRLILGGAWTFNHSSVALLTLDLRVIGVSGNLPAPAFGNYTFVIRDAATMGDFDAIGDHEIEMKNLKYLEQQGSCATPGNCTGFFAKAGTLTVTETTPRYRATFVLEDLWSRMDTSNNEIAPIPGTIAGCINASRS